MRSLTAVVAFCILLFGATGTAVAGDCDHPVFVEVGCSVPGPAGPPGADGADGVDGQDGQDGQDGVDGIDGVDGRDGIDGVNGRDGRDGMIASNKWIQEVQTYNQKYSYYAAASQALQIYLPQDQKSRLTFGMSKVGRAKGIGVGYAYVNEDGVALTVGIGQSHGYTVGQVSAGFEFGGERNRARLTAGKYKAQLECNFAGGTMKSGECVSR